MVLCHILQQGVRSVTERVSGNSRYRRNNLAMQIFSKVEYPVSLPAVRYFPQMQNTTKSINIMTENSKIGRPPSPNRCTHCVKVRFDDLEWDALTRMMEKADETVRATFFKRLVFGKPFSVMRLTVRLTGVSITGWCISPPTITGKLSPIRSRLRASANLQAVPPWRDALSAPKRRLMSHRQGTGLPMCLLVPPTRTISQPS